VLHRLLGFRPHSEFFQKGEGTVPDLPIFYPGGVGRKHGIFQYRNPLDQVVILKDETKGLSPDLHGKSFGKTGELSPLKPYPSGGGPGHAPEDTQKGGLSRSIGAYKHAHLIQGNLKVDPVKGMKLVGFSNIECLGYAR